MTSAQVLIAGAQHVGVVLDGEAIDRLGRFLAVFEPWNGRLRLTSERDLRAVVEKHVVDSLTPGPHLPPEGLVIDIGSGAGFPGIILGCVRPDLDLVLLESRRRRVSFLREALRSIPLPRAQAVEMRAEAAAKDPAFAGRAHVVLARAIRLDAFLPLAKPLVAPGGKAIAMQTPRTAERAADVGEACGLSLQRRDDYRLPGGAARSLLIFVPR